MIALCLCGTFKYADVKVPTADDPDAGMDLAEQCVATCVNYLGTKDEQAAITDALYPPLVRFDAAASGAEEGFIELWSKMDLTSLFGFPLWEEKVFDSLYKARAELQSIFIGYAKSKDGGSKAAAAALTMSQQELTDLALDCSLSSDTFPMERVVEVFESADAVKDASASAKGFKADGSLELHEFLEAVVKLSFARDNPQFGASGDASAVPKPLPGCLETMLKDNLLLNAKRDALNGVIVMINRDASSKEALARRRDALKNKFEKMAKADTATAAANKKGGPALGLDRFCQELYELGVCREVMVEPKSAVKGTTIAPVRTNLTTVDCKGAFASVQKVEKRDKGSLATLNADEFIMCLALCATIKYADAKDANGKPMPLGMMVDGMLANVLGEADEAKVVQKLFPPPPRFNPAKVASVPGKPAPPPSFMAAWEKMDLSHLWGFPMFEAGVFDILNDNFAELNSIFSQYANSATAAASDQHFPSAPSPAHFLTAPPSGCHH